ncbi:MAG: succinate dehydrogenase cytochrome b558 subunit [Planctomycetota bacterium]
MEAKQPFLHRHEFFIRRLHSLCGLIPVGAYMVVHLLTNATVLDSPATFQSKVYQIHSLGVLLPFIEWTFIFIPILFHAILGVVIIRGGLPNSSVYNYTSNIRYTAQRVTGMIAFFFIVWHVFHMHGWFHFDAWINNVADRLMGAKFRAYNAASSTGAALQGSLIVQVLYAIGILSCVFHLANGIWTMGITWGVWVSPAAQRRANYVCGAFGAGLAVVGMAALVGMANVNVEQAREEEDKMYEARVAAGELIPNSHKRTEHGEGEHEEPSPATTDEVAVRLKPQADEN